MQDLESLLAIALIVALVAYAFSRPRKRGRGSGSRRVLTRGAPRGMPPGDFTAHVAWVIDGDTVDVVTGGRKFRIRLDSIDCPEDGQDWGDTATFGLIKLIGGKTVFLENHGVDDYGRILATIYVSQDGGGRLNVNERMVALGHAWVMRRYYGHLPRHRQDSLNRIERWAKSRKVGLWRSPDPVPPWQWRATNGR